MTNIGNTNEASAKNSAHQSRLLAPSSVTDAILPARVRGHRTHRLHDVASLASSGLDDPGHHARANTHEKSRQLELSLVRRRSTIPRRKTAEYSGPNEQPLKLQLYLIRSTGARSPTATTPWRGGTDQTGRPSAAARCASRAPARPAAGARRPRSPLQTA
jgi:hypothetical protein